MSNYDAVYNAAREAFDISHVKDAAHNFLMDVAREMQRPCVLFKPSISIDGNKYCALYGENLQDGVAGFGDSPAEAMNAFDVEWYKKLEATR